MCRWTSGVDRGCMAGCRGRIHVKSCRSRGAGVQSAGRSQSVATAGKKGRNLMIISLFAQAGCATAGHVFSAAGRCNRPGRYAQLARNSPGVGKLASSGESTGSGWG